MTKRKRVNPGTKRVGLAAVAGLTLSLIFAGCDRGASKPGQPATNGSVGDHASTSHTHVAPHGGQIQAVGDHHFELTYESEPGRFTLYLLGESETQPAPIDEPEVTLQIRDEKSGKFQSLTLSAEPLEGETAGSSRFAGSSAELAGLGTFDAVARVPVNSESHRAAFQFVNGKPLSATLASATQDGYACPMNCEKNKVYDKPGKCPVCKMKLEEHKAGVTAHADHNPKHGGTFFMAPDNWHHLEGTLVSPRELRIYLYDNFTKPLASTAYSGELKVQPVDENDEERGESVTVPIKPVPDKPYLVAELPESVTLPFQSEARLQFPDAEQKYLFNFDFKAVQHKD